MVAPWKKGLGGVVAFALISLSFDAYAVKAQIAPNAPPPPSPVSVIPSEQRLMSEKDLPKDLSDWVSWAKISSGKTVCPSARCSWVSSPSLSVNAKGASWVASVKVLSQDSMNLPVFDGVLPSVKLDGKPYPLSSGGGVSLLPGVYKMSAEWTWDKLPSSLSVPQGALPSGTFVLNGKERRVSEGLAQEEKQVAEKGATETEMKVFKMFKDTTPVSMRVLIRGASPKNGPVEISGLLPNGFVWADISSSTNAKVSTDGILKMTTGVGNWEVSLLAYGNDLPEKISRSATTSSGKFVNDEEFILLSRDVSKRKLSVSGGKQVDAAILSLPSDWGNPDVWSVKKSGDLIVREDARGLGENQNAKGRVETDFILTSTGDEWFAKTSLDVNSSKISRAETTMRAETMARNNRGIMITDASGNPGVYVPPGQSRISGVLSKDFSTELPLSPWTGEWDSASGRVLLPTGWGLLGISGHVSSSLDWFSSWTLFDVFILSILLVLCRRSFGWGPTAVLGSFCLMTWHDASAPKWVFFHAIMIGFVLGWDKLLTFKKAKIGLMVYGGVLSLGVFFVILPYSIDAFRVGLFPSLKSGQSISTMSYPSALQTSREMESGVSLNSARVADSVEILEEAKAKKELMGGAPMAPAPAQAEFQKSVPMAASPAMPQENMPEGIQVGRQVPSAGKYVSYNFSAAGKVSNGETFKLYLSPPWLTRLGDFIRGLLPLLFLGFAFGKRAFEMKDDIRMRFKSVLSVLVVLLMLSANDNASAAFPSQEMLSELGNRVVEKACQSSCSIAKSVSLSVDGDTLKMKIAVDAPTRTEFVLPGNSSGWLPFSITESGAPVWVSRQGEVPVVLLEKGSHELVLTGKLISDTMTIPLNSSYPKNGLFLTDSPVWKANFSSESLVLRRQARETEQERSVESWKSSLSGAWILVRTFYPEKDKWRISSKIQSVGSFAPGKTFVISLLPNEKILSENVSESEGKVSVPVAPASSISWESSLPFGKAVLSGDVAGIPVIYRFAGSDFASVSLSDIPVVPEVGLLAAYPKEKEKFSLNAEKLPQNKSSLVSSGASGLMISSSDKTLSMSWNTSFLGSIGSDREIEFPAGYTPKRVLLNNVQVPFKSEGGKLSVSVPPGRHSLSVEAESSDAWGVFTTFKHPKVSPTGGAYETKLDLNSRWVLWFSSSTTSPVMFFWGSLIVLLGMFYAISKLPGSVFSKYAVVPFVFGVSSASYVHAFVALAWFAMFSFYTQISERSSGTNRKTLAALAGFVSLAFIVSIFALVKNGLLGTPDMAIIWNETGSWKSDVDPEVLVFSFPLWIWHLCMLAWAVWMSRSLVSWMKGAWDKVYESLSSIPEETKVEEPVVPPQNDPEPPKEG